MSPLARPSYCRALFFVAAMMLSGSASPAEPAATARPEDVGMSSARLERIKPAMQRYIDRREVSGTVTLVARRGWIVHLEAQGMRDAEAGAPMTTDAIFRVASMTKPITSAAVMMLFEEGHFLLSDPVSKWLPEFADPKVIHAAQPGERLGVPYRTVPSVRPITIRHLLTHTAGLANTYRGLAQAEFVKAAARQKPDETVADQLRRLARLPLNFQPGEAWEYGPATNVLGRLVELISGSTLDAFFRERIFQPLGMIDTHFYLPAAKLPRLTAQYQPGEGNKIKLGDPASAESRFVKAPHVFFSGEGGLVSTASDYWRFQQMMLGGGELDGVRLLGRKTVELMTANHIGDLPVWLTGPGFGFGLGYSVVRDVGATGLPGSIGNFAWGGAFCTYSWVDPIEEVVGVIMTQVRPYDHLNIRAEFLVLVNQSIVDSAKARRTAQGRESAP